MLRFIKLWAPAPRFIHLFNSQEQRWFIYLRSSPHGTLWSWVCTLSRRKDNWVKLFLLFTVMILASALCQSWQRDLFSWEHVSEIDKGINESSEEKTESGCSRLSALWPHLGLRVWARFLACDQIRREMSPLKFVVVADAKQLSTPKLLAKLSSTIWGYFCRALRFPLWPWSQS